MQNVKMSVDKGILTITVSLDAEATPSASGKTMVLASTRGNATVEDGTGGTVCVGVNVYRKR